jgi:hypothetical protein
VSRGLHVLQSGPNLYAGVMKVRKQHKRTAQTLALVAEI